MAAGSPQDGRGAGQQAAHQAPAQAGPPPWQETRPPGRLALGSRGGREARTDLIRERARAEAAEVAELVAADITHYWTPDTRFLRPHAKLQLLGMLVEMKAEDVRAASLKKDELVDWVAEQAASRAWAPSSLSWSLGADEAAGVETAGDETVETDEGRDDLHDDSPDDGLGDGTGSFVITPAGEAVLETAAA